MNLKEGKERKKKRTQEGTRGEVGTVSGEKSPCSLWEQAPHFMSTSS